MIEGVCEVTNSSIMKRYYKKRRTVTNKKFNTSIDNELTRLESQRKPRVKRNGTIIDNSQDISEEIQELHSLKQFKRITLELSSNNRINTTFFNTPCVYRLYDNETLVYVGQTTNLAKRIGQHLKDKVFTSFDIYSHIDNDTVRLNVERRLIQTHKPKYNIQHK